MCFNLFKQGEIFRGSTRLFLCIFLIVFTAALCCPARAGSSGGDVRNKGMQSSGGFDAVALNGELEALARSNRGSYGMYLKVLETGNEAGYQADTPFYAASCYKLFQVMYVYEGAVAGDIDLGRIIVYQGCDYQDGCGVIQKMPMGSTFTTRELCEMAIVYSDNIAANMLRRTYGYANYRDYASAIGCPVTGQYGPNQTTAREMCIVLTRVLQLADISPLGQEVIDFLRGSIYKTRIPAGLPEGVAVGNKTGDYQGYLNDAAIVFHDDLTYVLCVLSYGAQGGHVHAEASRLTYERISHSYCGGGHCTAGAARPATQWYFAEGTTREDFETWLCLANPGAVEAHTAVRAMSKGGEVWDMDISVPASSRTSLYLNGILEPDLDIALCVASDQVIFAERPLYFRYRDIWAGGHCVCGINQPAREWYFAEGTTREGFETWLCLANPGDVEAEVEVDYLLAGGVDEHRSYRLSPLSRSTLLLNEVLGDGLDVSSRISSDIPVLAERSIYFKPAMRGSGGHCVTGIPGAGREWCFAEGCSREGFEQWLCIGNPNILPVKVQVEFMSETGETITQDLHLGPRSRFTLRVNDAVDRGHDISTRITSDLEVIVERPMYFLFSPMYICN